MADIFEKCKNYKDAKLAMRMGIYGYFQPIESAQGPEERPFNKVPVPAF